MEQITRILAIHRSCVLHGEQFVPLVRRTRINCCVEMDKYEFQWLAYAAASMLRVRREVRS